MNAQDTSYVKAIKDEILVLYTFGKYYKMDKRMLLLDRFYNREPKIKVLVEFFNSSAGALGKIKGDLEAILSLITKFPTHLPWGTILLELNNMKDRFANIYEVKIDIEDINELLSQFQNLKDNEKDRDYLAKKLDTLIEYLANVLNKTALEFNKKNKLHPLPKFYM